MGGWRVENPRWLRRVLRTVGLMGEGDTGVRGRGDFSAGLTLFVVVGRARESLGLAARASILAALCAMRDTLRLVCWSSVKVGEDYARR